LRAGARQSNRAPGDDFQPIFAQHAPMNQTGGQRLKAYFLGWQCRIRQIAVRQLGGMPMPAMRPRVSTKQGELIAPAVVSLLVPLEPAESTAYFKFQVQRTNEPEEAREAALEYLGADYFQLPENFSDEMTAVFGADSPLVVALLKAGETLLDFEQYAQRFRLDCKVRRLRTKEQAHDSSFWQARLFNPNLPKNAAVLAFKPDWKRAQADPTP
jgi:hypothetical protein